LRAARIGRRIRVCPDAGLAEVIDHAQGPRRTERIRLHRFTGSGKRAAAGRATGLVMPRT
jgi:hypothetical protein